MKKEKRKCRLKKEALEELYSKYNKKEFIHPDPLEFLYWFDEPEEREIVGLIASSLAYGRVSQILKSISYVLEKMCPSPLSFLKNASLSSLRKNFFFFRHRFTDGVEFSMFLFGIKKVLESYRSLEELFLSKMGKDDDTTFKALAGFVYEFKSISGNGYNSLLPSPENGSALKRLNLFLRWMVRKDEVDPGCWRSVSKSKLIFPVDTHIHRLCLALNLTKRSQADFQTALEITNAFREIEPSDPLKYDFALSRLGILRLKNINEIIKECIVDEG